MSMGATASETYVSINPYGGAGDGTGPIVGGERQDLTDILARIDPTETPFFSNAAKASMRATYQEWQVQELNTVSRVAQPEGFVAALQDVKTTLRLGNDAQILARSWSVSRTFDAIDVAGRARESAYQKMLRGLELRRDLEAKLLDNTIRGAANRTLSGFITWITNGGQSGAQAAAGDQAWGDGVGALPPDGDGLDVAVVIDPLVLSFALIDSAMEKIFNAGGEPSAMQMTPAGKRVFSALGTDSLAVQNQMTMTAVKDAAYIGSVSVYLSDFGRLDVAVDRFQPSVANGIDVTATTGVTDTVFLIDRRHVQVTTLPGRSFTSYALGIVGDASEGYIAHEGSLRVSAPKAHGFIAHVG